MPRRNNYKPIFPVSYGQMKTKELEPKLDSHKSYYGKAYVVYYDDKIVLYSYGSKIMEFNDTTRELRIGELAAYSPTTRRHVRDFVYQYGINFDTNINNIRLNLGKSWRRKGGIL